MPNSPTDRRWPAGSGAHSGETTSVVGWRLITQAAPSADREWHESPRTWGTEGRPGALPK